MDYYRNGNVRVRDSEAKDIDFLKDNLREADIQEIWASHRVRPAEALSILLKQSETCMTILIKEEPVGIFGITCEDLLSDVAFIWMLATNGLMKFRKSFIKECKGFINSQLENYATLEGYVHEKNQLSKRWLKWCGCDFGQTIPFGIDKELFTYFCFKKAKGAF